MASNHSTQAAVEEDYIAPLSPFAASTHTSKLSIGILCLFELDNPLEFSLPQLGQLFLSLNSRFSCITVKDEITGAQYWRKVAVAVEDHIKVPSFDDGLPPDSYDHYLQEYLAEVAIEPFPESKPLWELHIFNYPTTHAAASVALKLHHALGDGYSLMGALLSCAKRADDPSLPLTYPSSAKLSFGEDQSNVFWKMWDTAQKIWRTTSDLGWRLLHVTRREDDCSAIRSGNPGIISVPVTSNRVVISLDRIREVKNKVGSTVNDVVTGMIFFGIHLYNHRMGYTSKGKRMTLLMALNTRTMRGYQSVKDMIEAKSWGNYSTLVQILMPSCTDVEKEDPMNFIFEAKKTMSKKKKSLLPFIMSRLLKLLWNLKGPEVVSLYYKEFVNNSSMVMSNIIGPKEKIKLAEQELKNICFFLTGLPNSVVASVMSYNGQLTIVVTIEKGFIAPKLFISCMSEAFECIYDLANRTD
ncbi:wax ester synthase/diacylglycerol acyltransferase 11-like [Aristolochia californica]|uniref:wax ester synthase/diacylglycerol acyltransferase 11-like n=1 Tax=Aristolochia californica TaxID=171875 RepID=UPI0035DD9E84